MAAWIEKFKTLTNLTHSEQAQWWLNGFWEEGGEANAEAIWEMGHLMIEIETGVKVRYGKRSIKAPEGSDVDEMKAHVFLEKMGETLTVRALRARLKDLDIDNSKTLCLSEYLLAKYNDKTPQGLVGADQGSGVPKAEMDGAVAQLDALQEKFAQTAESLEKATAAAAQAEAAKKSADAAAEQAAADKIAADAGAAAAAEAQILSEVKAEAAATADEALAVAEVALQAAVDDVESQEKAIADKIAGFESIINDEASSGVKKSRAKNELAQVQGEDPLPLRKAKITQGASLKRAQKARAPAAAARAEAADEAVKAAAATEAAEQAAVEAARTQQAAEDAAAQAAADKQAADDAQKQLEEEVKETEVAVGEAQAVLVELKSRKGTPHGKIWWMERQIIEAQKFMPSK